jgi:hypothetical protein
MDWYIWLGWSMVWLSVVLTVVRGVPVLYDAMGYMRDQASRNPA